MYIEPRFDIWIGKISWRRDRQPTPVFLLGESHGQRNLVIYSPWGHKELGMTEQLSVRDIITIPKNKEFFNVIKYAVSVQIS